MLTALLATVTEAAIAVDGDGLVTHSNAAAQRFLGATPAEALGMHLWRVLALESIDRGEDWRPAGLAEREVELRAVGPDRRPRRVRVTTSPLSNGGAWLVLSESVAPIDRAEDDAVTSPSEVLAREGGPQRLLDALPVGVFVALDRDCKQVTGNPAGCELLGISRGRNASKSADDAEGLPFRIFRGGAEVAVDDLPMQRAARDGVEVRDEEYDIVRDDGSSRTLLEYASPIVGSTGEVQGCVGTFVDITPLKRVEEALRESESYFRTMADNIAQLAWMADETGAIFWYNRRWYAFTGTTLDEMKGWGWTKVHHPDHLARVVERFRSCISAGEPWEDTFPLRGANGEYRWYLSRALPVFDPRGAIVRWFGTNTDVTEQREAQAEREGLLVREREARESAERADQLKEQFLATLAHELRNPLAPLQHALEVMRLVPDNGDARTSAIGVMERQVRQVSRLVDDLLDMSRVNQGKLVLRRELVDLADVLAEAIEVSEPTLRRAGHELVYTPPDEPVPLWGDSLRLVQIFGNLLNNASKFTPSDGGRIELQVQIRAGRVEVVVRDNGIGISAAERGRIFEIFAQEQREHDSADGGLGIGLSLVKAIVELHEGTVVAESDGRNTGSKFTVELPLADVDSPAWEAAAVPTQRSSELVRAQPPTGRRILIADDNRDAGSTLARLLRLHGHKVWLAHDGVDALERCEAVLPEVVLMDLGMPRLGGLEAAREIRRQPWGRDMLLLAVTGWGNEQDRARTREAGFDGHLVKPVDLHELSARLEA